MSRARRPKMAVRSPSRKAMELAGDDPEKKLTIRIPESVRTRLKMKAASSGGSVQGLILEALRATYPEVMS